MYGAIVTERRNRSWLTTRLSANAKNRPRTSPRTTQPRTKIADLVSASQNAGSLNMSV